MIKMPKPSSCDTFVVLPPGTNGTVIFGKNSDRPNDEVQEVVYVASVDYHLPSKVKCTYIEVEQVQHTAAIVISKPSWMWGAEMGANEYGVCIGNEAVWTKLNGPDDSVKRLLGMDLLRLALERSKTALQAVHVITALLETYGQGGNCSDILEDFTYHNSFLIADPQEAWVLECPGKYWAAEKISSGVRNISNELSIGTKIDLMHPELIKYAEEKNFWKRGGDPFNFKIAYGIDDDDEESYRYKGGKNLLRTFSSSGNFSVTDMFKVLRNKLCGICMSHGSFITTGSQVSVLRKADVKTCCHWFTATPDPSASIFKPFIFVDDVTFPPQVVSSFQHKNSDQQSFDYRHELYKLHEKCVMNKKVSVILKKQSEIENSLVQLVDHAVSNCATSFETWKSEVRSYFQNSVDKEMDLYKSAFTS